MKLLLNLICKTIICGLLILPLTLSAQDSDELFQQARKAAFDNKDYPKAIKISKEALTQSPVYKDIRIFLGRLYSWSDKKDSARVEFETVLSQEAGHEDAILAYASLE